MIVCMLGGASLQTGRTGRGRILARAAVLAGLVGVGAAVWFNSPAGRSVRNLPRGVAREDYDLAARELAGAGGTTPSEADVYYHLSATLAQRGDWQTSLACLDRVPPDHPEQGHWSRFLAGHLWLSRHRAREAEVHFREFLALEREAPQLESGRFFEAVDELLNLLLTQLRLEERHSLLNELRALHGSLPPRDELESCFPTLFRWSTAELREQAQALARADSRDISSRIAVGRHLTALGRLDQARDFLEACCAEQPDSREAQAALLECLFEMSDEERIERLVARWPPAADDDPWLLSVGRGRYALQQRRFSTAETEFQRVLAVDPCHLLSLQGLADVHREQDRLEEHQRCLQAVQILGRIQGRLTWAMAEPNNPEPYREIVALCDEAGFEQQSRQITELLQRLPPGPAAPARQPAETATSQGPAHDR
jgi:tetratricopeptide (TPR) repeat protein